jgi:hypothetical protein
MFHVALIDITDKTIGIAEEYEENGERDTRAGHLALQAELNEKGCNPDAPEGHEWRVVIGEAAYAFPEEP